MCRNVLKSEKTKNRIERNTEMNKSKSSFFNKPPGSWIAAPFRYVRDHWLGIVLISLVVCLTIYGAYLIVPRVRDWLNRQSAAEQKIIDQVNLAQQKIDRAKEKGLDQPPKAPTIPPASVSAPAPAPAPVTSAPTATPPVTAPVQAPVAQKPTPKATAENPAVKLGAVARPVAITVAIRPRGKYAKWDNSKKMFRDSKGEFITPPNYYIWRVEDDGSLWFPPFDEWEEMHIEEARQIRVRHSGEQPVYLNYANIVRKHPEAKVVGP